MTPSLSSPPPGGPRRRGRDGEPLGDAIHECLARRQIEHLASPPRGGRFEPARRRAIQLRWSLIAAAMIALAGYVLWLMG